MTNLSQSEQVKALARESAFTMPPPEQISREKIRIAFTEAALIGPISFLASLLVAFFLYKDLSTHAVVSWLIGCALLSLMPIIIHWRFKKQQKTHFELLGWQRFFLAGQLGIGLYWSYAALFLMPDAISVTPLLAIAIVAGVLVYASTVLTMNFYSFLCFAMPPLAAIMIKAFISDDDTARMVRFIYFLFGIFLIYSAFMHSRHRNHALVNRINNLALIKYLNTAKEHSDRLNGKLEHEVEHRKLMELALKAARADLENKVFERTQDLTQSNELLNQQISLRKKMSNALIKSQTRLSQAIEASQLELWDWDLVTGKIHQTSTVFNLFDYSSLSTEDFFNKTKDIIHPDDYLATRAALLAYITGETQSYQVKYRLKTKNDQWCWAQDHGKAVDRDAQGRVTRIIGTRRNIDAEYRKEEDLRLSKSVIDSSSEGIFILDADFIFVSSNPSWLKMMGLTEKEIRGKTLMDVSHTPQKVEVFAQARNEAAEHHVWEAELFEKRQKGEYFPMWLRLNTILGPRGNITHYAGLANDLSDRRKADEKLNYLLNYDDLTGLANRPQLLDRMHQALIAVRSKGFHFSLIIINIDRFKLVNESIGHKNGDIILKEMGHRIKITFPNADIIARLGNDEFAILMDSSSRDVIAEYADKLLSTLSKPYALDDQPLRISCSMGIVRAPQNSKDLHTLLHQADIAVRQAKYLGGMNYQFYIEALQVFSQYRISIESELRNAIQNKEFEVFYQPKMTVSSGLIESAEALVRWRHPERGLVSPSEFVHVAEESGLISEIGLQVLLKACIQTCAWRDAGLGKIKTSVNLSAHQLRQKNITQEVMKALQQSGL